MRLYSKDKGVQLQKWENFTNFLTDWFIKQEFLGVLHDEKEKVA